MFDNGIKKINKKKYLHDCIEAITLRHWATLRQLYTIHLFIVILASQQGKDEGLWRSQIHLA